MTISLIAAMPRSAWLNLYVMCAAVAIVGAIMVRRQRQNGSSRFPLSLAALISGPVLGLLFGAIGWIINHNHVELIDLKREFGTMMAVCSLMGCVAGTAFLAIVDLPCLLSRRNDVSQSTSDGSK
jgi:hypothetical protein